MASFIDVARTVFGTKYSILKIAFISIILAYPVYNVLDDFQGWTSLWCIVSYCIGVFYIGYISLAAHNLSAEEEILLPGFFNPFKILMAGIGSVITLAPITAGMIYLGGFLSSLLSAKGIGDIQTNVIIALIELVLLGIAATQFVLFVKTLNPLSGFNIIKIFKVFLSFIIKTFLLLIILTIVSGVILYPLGYLSYKMFGLEGLTFWFIMSIFLSCLLLFITQYYTQLSIECIDLEEVIQEELSALDKELLIDRDKN